MKYALLIAEQNFSNEGKKPWLDFSCNARSNMEKLSGLTILNAGAYLFDLSNGLENLSALVLEAKRWQVSYRVLFFESEPEWVPPTRRCS